MKRARSARVEGPLLTFDDRTGQAVDTDTRGSEVEISARFAAENKAQAHGAPEGLDAAENAARPEEVRGRGRPKLGVVAREVTLLPRHWEWLASQPGGASVALRKLVEEARKQNAERDRTRAAHERAYHFMVAIAGNLPGYEEATRALFANDRVKFGELVKTWPVDVRDHAIWLAFGSDPTAAVNETAEEGPAR